MTRRPRASLYVRLSKQADDSNTSKESMIADLRAMCATQGFDEVALHVDDGKSGAIRNRPEFMSWLNDARLGRADALLAWHVDRMTREGLNVAAVILDVVEGKDPESGKVVFPPVRLMDAKGLDSANGAAFRIMFLIRAEIAREERERIKDRLKGKSTRLRKMGRWPGGDAPYGYEAVEASDGRGKALAINEKEAGALREAARRILGGHTLGATSRWMNDNGHTPRRTDAWSRVTLGQALTGDHILGRITTGGALQRDEQGRPLTPFPAVLDLPTVVELRRLLAPAPDGRKRGGRKPSRLLSRVIECDSCGGYLTVIRRSPEAEAKQGRPAKEVVAYRCQRRADGGVCDHPTLASAEPIEEYVTRRFLLDFGHAPMVEERVIAADATALATVEEALAAVLASLAVSATPENFARLQSLQAERDLLAAAPREPVVERIFTGHTMGEEWERRDLDGKRDLLRQAYAVLRLKPGKRGRRGFDESRLIALPAEGTHDPDD